MLNFIENFLFKIDLKAVSIMKRKSVIFLNPTGWAKPLENGLIPPLDGSDGDVGVGFATCIGFFTTVKLD